MKPLSRKKIILAAIGVLILALIVYRFFSYRTPMAVIVVKPSEIRGMVYGPGTVQSKVPVTVSANITGILEAVHADQGDHVKKGQLLAQLDMRELTARAAAARAARNRAQRDLGRAKADLVKAEASLALARSNYERDLEVFKPGYISQAAFDATQAALKVAESEVGSSRAAEEALEAQVLQAESESHAAEAVFDYAKIKAPMDGLITVRKAEAGDTISPGTPIFEMVDYQIWAASWIDETRLGQLREGQKASIRLRSGSTFPGQVARLNREADTVTRELEVDVKFDEMPSPLVIGEETRVEIETGRQTALAVPLSAILEQNGQTGVLVLADGKIRFRAVTLGLQDTRRVAVLSGLEEGEMVVVNPGIVGSGQRVRPEIGSDAGQRTNV